MKKVSNEKESIFEKILSLSKDINNGKIDEIQLTKCAQICNLIESEKLSRFLDVNINDPLLFLSASQSLKINNGKALGFITNDPKTKSKLNFDISNSPKKNKFSCEEIYGILSKYRFDLEIDNFVSFGIKSNHETINIIEDNNNNYDLVHICSDSLNARNINTILNNVADGGFIIDEILGNRNNLILNYYKEKVLTLFECNGYIIYKIINDNSFNDVKFEYLKRKLITIQENVHTIKLGHTPTITVGVVAYNIDNYIQECLSSIVHQRGNFNMNIVIFEDHSTDLTYQKIMEFVNNTKLPGNINIEVNRNKKNVGLVENYHLVINRAKELNNDFFALVDGDDYFIDDGRLQKHIDFLNSNPDLLISFDGRILFYEENETFSVDSSKQYLNKSKYNLFDLLEENFMGTGSVLRGDAINKLPDELFRIFTADWFIHIIVSQFGDIGFIKNPMFVYRIHKQGDWSGRTPLFNYQRLYNALNDFNRITNYNYDPYINKYQRRLYNEKFDEPFEDLDLLIIDDVFPHPSNSYRLQEYESYLKHFEKIKVLSAGVWTHLLGKESNSDIVKNYKRKHKDIADKIVCWEGYSFNGNIRCKLGYVCFLGNAYPSLDIFERLNIPFVLELYPGGSFGLDNPQSDQMLKRVMSSRCFRKVIVTQKATYDYLLRNKFCDEEDIIKIFGVVVPIEDIRKKIENKKHFGINKKTLDICFVAMKYTKFGSDKGYDLFIEAAKKLSKLHKDIYFHVVGGFDEQVIDVSRLKGRIKFYGYQKMEWFDSFYEDKDIILSPTREGLTHNGAFDGFPTAACTDAGLRETAIFCTDPLALNDGYFKPGVEIEIIKPDVTDIVDRVDYYYKNPDKLVNLSQNGRKRIQKLYNYNAQIKPRIELLEKELSNYYYWIDKNNAIQYGDLIMKKDQLETQPEYKLATIANYQTKKSKKIIENFARKLLKFAKKVYKRLLIQYDVKLIKKSPLFDADWYFKNNLDIVAANANPYVHYLRYGAYEGRNPSPYFDSRWYLETYPDVKNAGINPLVHFIKFGQFEGRMPTKYPVNIEKQ